MEKLRKNNKVSIKVPMYFNFPVYPWYDLYFITSKAFISYTANENRMILFFAL